MRCAPRPARRLFYAARSALTGAAPEESLLVGPLSAVHLTCAVDLAVIVPSYLLAAVLLLWRREPWGFVLAGMVLTAGTLQQVDYLAQLLVQTLAGVPGATAFDAKEVPIVTAYLAAAVVLLRGMRRTPSPPVAAA